MTIARQFLTGSDLSVAVVDKAVPCSGATGAGKKVSLFFFYLFSAKFEVKKKKKELTFFFNMKVVVFMGGAQDRDIYG